MLKNYLLTAWRNLIKNKIYSFINLLGLATGMAVVMLIGLWMHDEFSANKVHANYATLYRIMMHQTFDGRRGSQEAMPYPTGEELKSKFPDFKAVAMCDWGADRSLQYGEKKISRPGHFIGEDAVQMFTLKVLAGATNPLHDPYSIVLTKQTADALFGKEEAIGKTVKVDNTFDVKVTAVVEQLPKNSTLSFEYLLPFSLEEIVYPWIKQYHKTNWANNSWQVFVQLQQNANPAAVNAKIKNLIIRHLTDANTLNAIKPEVFIHPMAKWRLYSDFENGVNTGGFIRYVRMFGILGAIVLLIACINFMNLSTARSEKRAKEVGVRKSVGGGRGQLIAQFLSESLLIATLSLVLALVMVWLSLPSFNRLTEKAMSLQLASPLFWCIMIGFTAFTGLLSGSYPAFYLSSFNPVRVLKGNLKAGKSGSLPRKILVVVQFSSAVALMIGTLVVYKQIQFGKNQPIGFNNKGLISIDWSADIEKNLLPITQEMQASGAVLSSCQSNSPVSDIFSNNNGWEWPGSQPVEKSVVFSTIATAYDYTKTLGIKLLEGRDFSRSFADSNGVLLNQAAVKRMALAKPVGTMLKWNDKPMVVLGVIPDIQMESPFRAVSPLTIVFNKRWVSFLTIRLNPNMSASAAISKLKPIFDKYNPGYPFAYKFADEEYAKKFNYVELVGNLSAVIAVLIVFISCLGLFGLSSFTVEQRVKEIGVRKVLGASTRNLWQLLSKDFVWLVLVACIIAVPLSWYAMQQWLAQYENKISIGVDVFVLVIVTAIVITLLTVSFQTVRAARANPSKSLRTE